MRKVLGIGVATSLVAGLFATRASAGVDAEVPLKASVKGSLAGETDVFRFWGTRGAAITFKFAGAKKHLFTDLSVAILDESDGETELPFPEGAVDTATKIQVKGLVLPSTGWYRVDLSGEGSGDYTFDLSTKLRTLWKGESDLTGGPVTVEFAVPAGSTATLTAKRKKGGLATPRWGEVYANDDEGGIYDADLSEAGKIGATSHSVPAGPLPGTEVDAGLSSAGGEGVATWVVKVKPPKAPKKVKLDLRSRTLGKPPGAESMLIRAVGPAGGSVAVEDEGSDLYGAAVSFPVDALAAPTFVSIASVVTPTAPDADDQPAGPAVKLGPGGVEFPGGVTVTLPFDDARLPVGADPGDIRILVVEDDGSTRIEVPDSVDTEADTVSVSTESFSVFTPIVPSGMPQIGLDPGGDAYWVLQFYSEIERDEPEEFDSRARRLGFGTGVMRFHGDGKFEFSMGERGLEWQNVNGISPPLQHFASTISNDDSDDGTVTWAYGGDPRTITISIEDAPAFRPSRDGLFMVGRDDAPTSTEAPATLLVKQHAGTDSDNLLLGRYHLNWVDLRGGLTVPTGGYHPAPTRGFGWIEFFANGTCSYSIARKDLGFNGITGILSEASRTAAETGAAYTVEGDPRTVQVTMAPSISYPDGAVLRLLPGVGFDVLVGTNEAVNRPGMAVVLTREQPGTGSVVGLDGPYAGVAIGVEPTTYTITGATTVPVGDFSLHSNLLRGAFDGTTSVDLSEFRHLVYRNPAVPGGVSVLDDGLVTPGDVSPLSVAVNSAGKVSLLGGAVVGGALESGNFIAFVNAPSVGGTDYGLAFFVRQGTPPE